MSILKRAILPAVIMLIAVVVISIIYAFKPTAEPNQDLLVEPPKIKAQVMPLQRETVRLSVTSQGTVQAKREIDLVAQVSGQIIKVEPQFEDGAFFKQNELLIEIDPRDYQAAYLNAQSRLAQAQSRLAQEEGLVLQAKREWRDLGNKKSNDLFLRKPQMAEAQSALAFAEADLRVAKLNLERTQIRVPFDGRVRQTLVDLGQFVAIGTPLAKVYDIASAEVRLPLSDQQVARLDLPLGVAEVDSSPEVTITAVIASKSYQWQGVISRTDASVDVNSRMYFAIAEIEKPFEVDDNNAKPPLLPGLFVTAEIAGKNLNDVVVLSRDALVKRENIYTLDADSIVQLTPVSVLKKQKDIVWIRSDLPENTAILYEKHALVSPGTQIEAISEQDKVKEAVVDELPKSNVTESE